MFKLIKEEFKHDNCDELNKELEQLISNLEIWTEGLNEQFMDVTMDYENRKSKEWEEMYADPHAWLESKLIQTEQNVVENIVNMLRKVVYTESIQTIEETKPKRQPYMTSKKAREWLIDNVKPLILHDGITVQIEIAKRLGVPNNTISQRVRSSYEENWENYVIGVQHGRY